jgi:hypothetical protein
VDLDVNIESHIRLDHDGHGCKRRDDIAVLSEHSCRPSGQRASDKLPGSSEDDRAQRLDQDGAGT